MAGEGEGVTAVMGSVVQRLRTGKTDAIKHEHTQKSRYERRNNLGSGGQ